MAWDWDANNIDVNEDNGKQWVPDMPQMMRTIELPGPSWVEALMPPTMPP